MPSKQAIENEEKLIGTFKVKVTCIFKWVVHTIVTRHFYAFSLTMIYSHDYLNYIGYFIYVMFKFGI